MWDITDRWRYITFFQWVTKEHSYQCWNGNWV